MTRASGRPPRSCCRRNTEPCGQEPAASALPLTLGPLGAFLLAERRKPPGFPTVIPDGSRRAALDASWENGWSVLAAEALRQLSPQTP